MSDAVIDAALADFRDADPQMDSMGNSVIGVDADIASGEPAETAPSVDVTSTDDVAPTTPEGTPAAAEAAQQDEIDKLLAKEGIEPRGMGRENRIPYSRTKKIIENAQKAWQADAESKFAPERQQFTELQGRMSNYERQEQLASQDPDRFISLLASVDPRYQKFLGVVGKEGAPSAPPADNDPEPQPAKDEQGNPYYTPEGWKAWQSWTRRQAAKEATTALETKFGPTLKNIQQQQEARATYEAQRPVVEAQTSRLVETYGAELVNKNQDAIIAAMEAAAAKRQPLTLAEAAAQVLLPQIRQDEAKIREKVIAEINKRPAAARGAAPTQRRPEPSDKPLTGDAVIFAELDRLMPNRNRS